MTHASILHRVVLSIINIQNLKTIEINEIFFTFLYAVISTEEWKLELGKNPPLP